MERVANKERRLIDMHVHMVGNGGGGSGGWLRLDGWHRWLAGFMLRQLGVPASALEGNLEALVSLNRCGHLRDCLPRNTDLQSVRQAEFHSGQSTEAGAADRMSAGRTGKMPMFRNDIAPRIVQGSDFPVPVLGHRLWLQGWIDRATFRRCQSIRNPLERDWQFKRALGFGDEVATRVNGLLRTPLLSPLSC